MNNEQRTIAGPVNPDYDRTPDGSPPAPPSADALPPFPAAAGTYWLKLVVTDGVGVLSWGETTEDCA